MESDNPKLEWLIIKEKECLKFTFTDVLTEQLAITAVDNWKRAFASKPDEKIILIWHCLDMEGYENKARSQWQKALKEMKSQIDCIWLVNESNIIRMGASIMSLFASFEIKVVSSENEIKI